MVKFSTVENSSTYPAEYPVREKNTAQGATIGSHHPHHPFYQCAHTHARTPNRYNPLPPRMICAWYLTHHIRYPARTRIYEKNEKKHRLCIYCTRMEDFRRNSYCICKLRVIIRLRVLRLLLRNKRNISLRRKVNQLRIYSRIARNNTYHQTVLLVK